MSGKKPVARAYASSKDTNEDGERTFYDLMAFWPMEREGETVKGVYSGAMRPFGKIADINIQVTLWADEEETEMGEVVTIDPEDFFLNLRFDDQASSKGGKGRGKGRGKKASGDEDFA